MINNDFYIFIKDNQIITTAIATIFSRLITDVSYSFIENILLPIINIDLDDDGKADIDSFKNKKIKISGVTLKIGPFLIEILKFISILYILYQLSKFK
jgi:large-conductance mechanosensitive channel